MTATYSKSLLAKLLAMENITIRRDASAKTASFDIKNRVMIMPIWHGISEDLGDMLTIHEVGHALDTPCDGWMNAIKDIAGKYHDKPTNRHTMAVKGFLNVIEDARIDKRQKRRYPGSRRNYLAGYKELIERGFFGPASRDFNTMSFIDRMNIYFKGGVALGIKFAPDEMKYLKRVESAETFAEVLALTDEIYGYAKSKGDEKQETPTDIDSDEDDEEFEFDNEMEGEGEGEESESSEETEAGKGQKSDEDGEESEDDEAGDGEESENEDEGDETSDGEEGSSGEPSDDDFVPESETDNAWQEKQADLADTSTEYVYVTVPKPNMKNIVSDYKVFLSENESYNIKLNKQEWIDEVSKQFVKFKTEENNTISFMVKEFEMRKSADMYSKISIAKTGVIDTNKMHSYKYNDDIFRRLATTPQGKNHGFIMFMDWSGSMQPELKSTLRQLLSMVLFCKRVQIPFEVYNFRDLNETEAGSFYARSASRNDDTQNCFETKTGDMMLGSFKMRNMLSSRMSLAELNRAFNVMWGLATNTYSRMEPMGGTPLNGAIIAATNLVNEFRARNKLQVVNTIFLTDGGSNPINGVAGRTGIHETPWDRNKKIKYVLQDDITKKEYSIGDRRVDGNDTTNALLKCLKERTGCNLIGFYLFSGYGRNTFQNVYYTMYGYGQNEKHTAEMKKSWEGNKFIPVTSAGYDEYFVIDARAMSETNQDLKVDSSMTKGKIAKAFLTFSSKKAVNRVLLQRFITLTSAVKAA